MKEFIRLIAVTVITGFTFASCTDVVKVDIDPGETLLVVDAWVNNLPGSQTIRLTTTSPFFSDVNTPSVSGASVTLNDLTNNKIYTFADAGNGNYVFTPVATDSMCVVNHQYQLNITYQGNSYNSFSKLNRTTNLDSIIWRELTNQTGNNLLPYLIGSDASGGKDYYWIKAYRNNVYENNPNNINLSEDAGGGDGTDGLYFIPPVAYFTVTPRDKAYAVGDTCKIEIHSLNETSYQFMLQAQAQMTNAQSGLFANTPQNVRNNINVITAGAPKALGWFNMAAVSVFKSAAKKP